MHEMDKIFLAFFSLSITLGDNLTLWCLMPDTERPQVQLSTTSLAKTKNHFVPVLIQFTEPVFGFASSGVTISGGTLTRQVHEKDPDCFYWHLDYTVLKYSRLLH